MFGFSNGFQTGLGPVDDIAEVVETVLLPNGPLVATDSVGAETTVEGVLAKNKNLPLVPKRLLHPTGYVNGHVVQAVPSVQFCRVVNQLFQCLLHFLCQVALGPHLCAVVRGSDLRCEKERQSLE